MLNFFRVRAIDGVEQASGTTFTRSIKLGSAHGILNVRHADNTSALDASIYIKGEIDVDNITLHLRRMFDLDADVKAIAKHLSRDPFLAPLIAKRPGLRVPGYWEPFETAIRTVVGQHVSRAAARRLNARLAERAGSVIAQTMDGAPHREFPTPQQLLEADLSNMGMPGARVSTLLAVAEAFITDPTLFDRKNRIEDTVACLSAIKGIGPWSANYIAIRACHNPDGFPASDAGLLRGMANLQGQRPTPKDLIARAEAWRPYRAYAAQQIWTEGEGQFPMDGSV